MELKSVELHIDPRKQQISARYLTEPSGCGSTRDLCGVANNRLVTLHEEDPKPGVARKPALSACRVIDSDLADGTMRVGRKAVRRWNAGQTTCAVPVQRGIDDQRRAAYSGLTLVMIAAPA